MPPGPVRAKRFVLGLAPLVLAAAAGAQQRMLATSGPVNPRLLTIDLSTGFEIDSVPITGAEALFGGLTREGTVLWTIDGFNDPDSDRTFRIDSVTGAGTVVGETGFNWNFRSVEVHPHTGVLYATRDNELFTLDEVTGAATSVGPITGATLDQFTCFAIDPVGAGEAYGLDIGLTGLFRLDLATGAATHLGNLSLPAFAQDAAFDSDHGLWVVLSGGDVYRIDVDAVAETLVFPSLGWAGIAFTEGAGPGTPICFGDGSGAPCGCQNESAAGSMTGCLNSVSQGGVGPRLSDFGQASASDPELELRVFGVLTQPGLFFQGANAIAMGQGASLGDGIRCCGGNVVRLAFVNPPPGPEPAFVSTTIDTAPGVSPGDTRCYQYWYRDPAGPCGSTFNLTNALALTWGP